MKFPDAIAPYASLLKWALIIGLLVAVRVEGCMSANSRNKADAATKDSRIKSLEASLTDFIALYDRTTAQTRDNAAAAKVIQDAGVALVIRTASERTAAAKALTKLEAQLEDERAGCVDGERKICGVPLK